MRCRGGGEGGGYRGQKKRQRGGASEAQGGLEMDGNILSFLHFLLLFLTLRGGSRLQQSCKVVGKNCKIHKSWAFIKVQINLSRDR